MLTIQPELTPSTDTPVATMRVWETTCARQRRAEGGRQLVVCRGWSWEGLDPLSVGGTDHYAIARPNAGKDTLDNGPDNRSSGGIAETSPRQGPTHTDVNARR